MSEQTTATELPITEMLEEKADMYIEKDIYWESFKECASVLKAILIPQVRALEEAQQKKAKEETLSSISTIMENEKKRYDSEYDIDQAIAINALQSAIERIREGLSK